MSDLTTKAAEIRAGLVADWRKAMEGVTPGDWDVRAYGDGDSLVVHSGDDWRVCFMATPGSSPNAMERIEKTAAWIARCSPAGIAPLLALIEQQAAELAEAWREADKRLATIDDLNSDAGEWNRRATTAESERDELLREKERLEAAHQKWWKERGGIGVACFGSGHDQERAFAKTDKEFAFAVANALSALENGPAGLADAHSKSPAPSSQSERIAVLEAALRPFAAIADIFDQHSANRPREGEIMSWVDHRVGERLLTVEMLHRARSALAPLGEE